MAQAKVKYKLVNDKGQQMQAFTKTLPNGSDTWAESQIVDYLPKLHQSSMYKGAKYILLERK
tara:strand:- start:536 stop:721 length:186 start_codon:yes stop_codon:yes gene_type:complete